jgi:hypothetical protein
VTGGLAGNDPETLTAMAFHPSAETNFLRGAVYADYVAVAGIGGERFRAGQTALGRFLGDVGVVVPGEYRVSGGRVYKFRPLHEMRNRFEVWIGQPVDWSEGDKNPT